MGSTQSIKLKMTEQGMGNDGAGNGRMRNGCTNGAERMFGLVGEKSIDFSRIPYRLFPDTSVGPLRQHGSNNLIALNERFDCMGAPLRSHRTTAPPPPLKRARKYADVGRLVLELVGEGALR